jgi:hypothetical protein
MRLYLLEPLMMSAAFAVLVAAPLGRRLLERLGVEGRAHTYGLALAAGTGVWGLLVLGLGLARLLYPAVVLGLAALLFLLFRFDRVLLPSRGAAAATRPAAPSSAQGRSRVAALVEAALAAAAVACLLVVLASALAPETAFDALNVHLPYSRDAAREHRIRFVPNNWSSAMPALPLMSYITGFLLQGVELAKLFNFLAYVTTGLVVRGFLARTAGRVEGLAGALLFWSSPIALYEGTTALIDMPLALYSAVGVLALLEWLRSGERRVPVLSAVGLGLALGCKYHALFWVPPALILVAWGARRTGLGARGAAGLVLRYGAIVALLAAPWLLRAWIYTGNPVFPAANGLFRSPYFTPAMEAAARAAYANEGLGTSVRALARLPFDVAFHPGPFRGTVGPIFLLAVLGALARAALGRGALLGPALLLAAGYFYAWALTAQEIRYLLPLVPLLAAVGGLSLAPASAGGARAEQSDGSSTRPGPAAVRYAGAALVIAAAVANLPPLYSRWVTDWTYWHAYQSPIAYLRGRQSAEEYLKRDLPSIYVYRYVNAALRPTDRILLLNDHAQFYSLVPTLYSFTVDGERVLQEETESGVLERMKEFGITHVLLNYNGIAPIRGVAPRRGVYFFLERSFRERHLESVWSQNNVILYRVRR